MMSETEVRLAMMVGGLANELDGRMASECANAGVSVSGIVGDAISYVVGGILAGRIKVDVTKPDVARLVLAKARLLVKDEYRASVLGHGRVSVRAQDSLDIEVEDSNREIGDYASVVAWKEGCFRDEMLYRYAVCRKVLDKVCEMKKISMVNRLVYKEVVLQEMPREEVAARYGITRNNVDQIVFRIKKGLAAHGRALFEEFYGHAA